MVEITNRILDKVLFPQHKQFSNDKFLQSIQQDVNCQLDQEKPHSSNPPISGRRHFFISNPDKLPKHLWFIKGMNHLAAPKRFLQISLKRVSIRSTCYPRTMTCVARVRRAKRARSQEPPVTQVRGDPTKPPGHPQLSLQCTVLAFFSQLALPLVPGDGCCVDLSRPVGK